MAKKTTKKSASKVKPAAKPAMADMMASKDTDTCCSGGCDCGAWTLMVLRVLIGAIFIYHGLPKLMNVAGTMGFFSSIGFWGWLGPVVGTVEVLAGIALILGMWTKWASYALAAVIAVAVVYVHLYLSWSKAGFDAGLERDLLILVSTFVLAWFGAGKWAVHKQCDCCC